MTADDEQQWIAETLTRLQHSAFRAKFVLTDKDRAYARGKGKATIDRHAHEMLRERVGAAEPKNDGTVAWSSSIHRPACHRHMLPGMHRKMASHTQRA